MKTRPNCITLFALALMMITSCTPFLKSPQTGIQKSPYDQREYRTLQLPNGLEALLISDPEADNAAAALSVGVGQFQDPVERQGLAHFLEHMLFLGTQKFPQADEYGSYLSAHGGSSNAYTSFEETNYFFTVNQEHLEGALDRFSQFFIAPNFDAEFVEREINAVNSEHQKNIKEDARRVFQVLRAAANPDHPFFKFGTGNLTSLEGPNKDYAQLRQELIDFYKNHYSADRMKLVILGKESLSKLESYAHQFFADVPNRNLPAISLDRPPVITDRLPRKITIPPIKAKRVLQLMFPVPTSRTEYAYKATELLSSLIGDEGAGSILAYLKEKGWAISLSSGGGLGARDFSFFSIRMNLTPEGLDHQEEIIEAIFQYLDLLRSQKDLQRYYNEAKQIADIDFQFREKEAPYNYVSNLASKMQEVPVEDVVASRWIYKEYRQDLIQSVLNRLVPENLQILLIAPEVFIDRSERWYQTPYGVQPIEDSVAKRWKESAPQPALTLPAPNPFIPKNITLKPVVYDGETPVLLKKSDKMEVWLKQSSLFRVPKGNIKVILSTKEAYSNVRQAAMTNLFTLLLTEELNQFAYPASVAGLNYSVANTVEGIELSLSGYPENIPLLFQKIVETAKALPLDANKFAIFKNQAMEKRTNQRLSQAYHRVSYESYYLMSETLWHFEKYIEILDSITMEELQAFLPKLLSQMNIRMLAHGNFTADDVQALGALLETNLTSEKQPAAEIIEERYAKLPAGSALVYPFAVEDVNSAVQLYYQAGPKSVEQNVLLDMTQQILEKPFYHQTRTIEQLGYIVWSGQRISFNVGGAFFLIQSSVKEPVFLKQRIESFLIDFLPTLETLEEKEFETFRASLIAKREEEPKNLAEETQRIWSPITRLNYDFDSRQQEIAALKVLTKQQVVDFYKRLFLDPETRSTIAVLGVGKEHQLGEITTGLLESPSAFKQSAEYYPNPTGAIPASVLKLHPENVITHGTSNGKRD